MEDSNKTLYRLIHQSFTDIWDENVSSKKDSLSTRDLQQIYGMGWHDAMNVKEHLSKQNQKAT
jgi:thymidylate synthase